MYTIKPLADGYGVYKDDKQVLWAYSYEWAQYKVEELEKADTQII